MHHSSTAVQLLPAVHLHASHTCVVLVCVCMCQLTDSRVVRPVALLIVMARAGAWHHVGVCTTKGQRAGISSRTKTVSQRAIPWQSRHSKHYMLPAGQHDNMQANHVRLGHGPGGHISTACRGMEGGFVTETTAQDAPRCHTGR